MTNDSGLFFLPGIPAGKGDFTVTQIGYGVVHFAIELETYSRPMYVPVNFKPANCVIAVWTKNYADVSTRAPGKKP